MFVRLSRVPSWASSMVLCLGEKRFLLAVLVAGGCLAVPRVACADLTISVRSTELDPGKVRLVDVFIRSSAAGTDLLDAFSLELRITPEGAPGLLQFTNPALDPQLNDPGYIFAGNSLIASSPPAGSILSIQRPNDTYLGGDATLSGAGVFVSTTDTLLTQVQVAASSTLKIRDKFTITPIIGPFTAFNDPLPGANPIQYTVQPGTVTIKPEPTSLAVWGVLFGLLAARRLARQEWRDGPRPASTLPPRLIQRPG